MERPEYAQHVHFGGHVECLSENGRQKWVWVPDEIVEGLPYDLPIVGYCNAVNSLRLWSAKAVDDFDLDNFNKGSYSDAVSRKVRAENLTKVLYPNDNMTAGKELRLASSTSSSRARSRTSSVATSASTRLGCVPGKVSFSERHASDARHPS